MNTTMTPTVGDTVSHSSSSGLSVGLSVVFLLVGIATGGIVYKYKSKIRNMLQFRQRRSQKKEDCAEETQDNSHQYSSLVREQSVGHTPIYENLTTQTAGYSRPAGHTSRSPPEPEEDLYLQCDSPDDAIYSNDPKCNLAILPSSQEDDVYIMPDS